MENNTQHKNWYKSIDYNAHDMGEIGKFIRVEYAKNILNDALQSAREEAETQCKISREAHFQMGYTKGLSTIVNIDVIKNKTKKEVLEEVIKMIEGMRKTEIEREFIAKVTLTFMGIESIKKDQTYKYKTLIDDEDKSYNKALNDIIHQLKQDK